MNSNTPSQKTHIDALASAFIQQLQQPVPEALIGSIDSDDFKNLPPFEMKRLLDFFVTRHGNLESWTFQDIVETFAADRMTADANLRVMHSADAAALRRHYGAPDAHSEITTSYYHFHYDTEIEFDEIEEGDPVTRRYKTDQFTLTVRPWNTDDFQAWAVVNATDGVFDSPFSKVVVYLELRDLTGDYHELCMQLDAPVFWLRGTELLATGDIEHIFLEDVIVTESSVIVPVLVTRDWRSPKRVDAMKSLNAEYCDQLVEFLVEANRVNARDTAQLELLTDVQKTRPFPAIAVEMEGSLGLEVREAGGYQYFKKKWKSQERICSQRRQNIRAWNGQ